VNALLQKLGIKNGGAFFARAFSRNLGLLSVGEQLELEKTRVAIPGLGGVGGVHLVTLIRAGVGKFHLADFDVFELQNFNRQYGAKVSALEENKLEVMTREALDINPFLDIKGFPEGVNEKNMDSFLEGVDVVVDSLDAFAIDTRRLLFRRAREKGIPIVSSGPVGFSTVLHVFLPDKGLSFDEYFCVRDDMTQAEKSLYFQLGLTPRLEFLQYFDLSRYNPEKQTAPSLGLACQLCSAAAATEVIRIVLKRGGVKCAPHSYQFDPYLRKMKRVYLPWGNNNPLQRLRIAGMKRILAAPVLRSPKSPEIPENDSSAHLAHFLLDAARQAPSGDNCQPWRFQVNANSIKIYLEESADTSPFNIGQFGSVVACGAALENLSLAARASGTRTQIMLGTGEDDASFVAEVKLKAGAEERDPYLFDEIWRRTTNRRMYARRKLLPATKEMLSGCIRDFPGAKLSFTEEPGQLRALARLIERVDRIRVENKGMHEFLYGSIRFSDEEARRTLDGMSVEALECGLSGRLFLEATRSWRMMNFLNRFGFSKVVAKIASRGMLHSSAAVLITVPSRERSDLVTGGRAMQRFWLELTRLGLYAQPMALLPILRNQWGSASRETFGAKFNGILETAWEEYQSFFPEVEMETAGQVILFRLGYDLPLRLHRTARKPVSDVLLEEIKAAKSSTEKAPARRPRVEKREQSKPSS